MKQPLIIEKQHICVIYIDVPTAIRLCEIANRIEENYPESVIEVTHLRNVRQGSIILNKDCSESMDEIKDLVIKFETL